jgi:hypothetical protein
MVVPFTGRGKINHKGRNRHFITEAEVKAEQEKERKDKEWKVTYPLCNSYSRWFSSGIREMSAFGQHRLTSCKTLKFIIFSKGMETKKAMMTMTQTKKKARKVVILMKKVVPTKR